LSILLSSASNREPEIICVPPYDISAYAEIIDAYRNFELHRLNDYAGTTIEDEFEQLYGALVDALSMGEEDFIRNEMIFQWLGYSVLTARFGTSYAVYDINGDGVPELFIGGIICSIYDGKPYLVNCFWERHRYELYADGTVFIQGSGGADNWEEGSYRLSEDGTGFYITEKESNERLELKFMPI
jgi:hypothetical protein